jgi:intein/homing endonuclease
MEKRKARKLLVLVGAQRNKRETEETKRRETEELTLLLEELGIKKNICRSSQFVP